MWERPDPTARIRRGATGNLRWRNNSYNTTGVSQTQTGSVAGGTVTYFCHHRERRRVADQVQLRGTASTNRSDVTYKTNGGHRKRAVTAIATAPASSSPASPSP